MITSLTMFVFLLFALDFFAFSQKLPAVPGADELPSMYFRLLDSAVVRIENRFKDEPQAGLDALDAKSGWSHFASSILIPAVLYTKSHSENQHFADQRMLSLALRIGDLLAEENSKGNFTPRGDSDWDTYMWLEAYRLLESSLGEARREAWKKALLENLSLLEPELLTCMDYPQYNAPFIITSPNHYAIYASTLLLAGIVFEKPVWKEPAAAVLHRFVSEEQSPDGYWGEHSQSGPTTGYDYLTETQIALYWEYSGDPDALSALRRSTDFHKYFTYPDGTPVETINDRNRYWGVSMWGHFGFSNFPDGRRYAAFLTQFFHASRDIQSLSRIAQNVLYYHEGYAEPIPQDQGSYQHRMQIEAGIRKTGPWVVCLSGLIEPADIINNFFLDRQGNMSIFNTRQGLIITGANSKRQPELATFTEEIGGNVVHMPISSRLQMEDGIDKLSLSYNTFFAQIEVPVTSEQHLDFRILTTYKWGNAKSQLNLQLVIRPGQILETGSGRKIIPGREQVNLDSNDLGGKISHNGWILHLPDGAQFTWPVYPFNPYRDGPETSLNHAVGIITVPLLQENQTFDFSIEDY
jgi:hypothetical protein